MTIRAPTTAEAEVIAAMLGRIAGLDPRRTADMLAIGSALLDIQNALPGRAFEPWRREHLPAFGRRSALNYMRAAACFGADPEAVVHLRPTAVVRLATQGVPEAERVALFDKARKGSALSAADVVRRAAAARARDAASMEAADREKRRRATARAWERQHHLDASAADEDAKTAATRAAARHIAGAVKAPDWLRQTVRFCDPVALRDMLLDAWAERDLETPVGAAPAPVMAKPAASPGIRLQKRKSPGG